METAAIIVGTVLSCVGVYLAAITYRDRRGRAQLHYVVTTITRLVPEGWAGSLQLVHNGQAVGDPWLVITRIVNVGDKSIRAEEFETPLSLKFDGSLGVASVNQTGQRPNDLKPVLQRNGDAVIVKPTLLNPGDMIELQVLTTGMPKRVNLAGRLSEVEFRELPRLPYPPGGGPEGEMLGLDVFMAFILPAVASLTLAIAIALSSTNSVAVRIAVPSVAILAGCVVWPWREKYLIKRRAMFKPEWDPETAEALSPGG
jgi:hypothetical protein